MNKQKNVFISHYNKDDDHIGGLKDLLLKRGYLLKNSSIDSTKPNRIISEETIRRLLRLRIHWAGTFICLVGPETHTRKWVDWEIDQANKKGKRIVGVYVRGATESELPSNLKKYGDAQVAWNGEGIIDAIEGNNRFETPEGGESTNQWDIGGYTC